MVLQQAEAYLGQRPIVSPLGNVVKIKADKSRKNRLIQYFKASCVNAAATVSERQVLPRFADHARDLATLSADGSSVGVFVLDFKHAFMTIPLAREEMTYNASTVPKGITRTRSALDSEEPSTGTVLLWRVLGFGGHANPLVYSRVASFTSRSGQALLFHPQQKSGIGHGRLQLYVDDPALVVAGNRKQQMEAIDLLVCWYLVLGIPLSWSKGHYSEASAKHEWIGVQFQVREKGVTTMSLPPEFASNLLTLAKKFSGNSKMATVKEAQELCGRAGRVAPKSFQTRALFF